MGEIRLGRLRPGRIVERTRGRNKGSRNWGGGLTPRDRKERRERTTAWAPVEGRNETGTGVWGRRMVAAVPGEAGKKRRMAAEFESRRGRKEAADGRRVLREKAERTSRKPAAPTNALAGAALRSPRKVAAAAPRVLAWARLSIPPHARLCAQQRNAPPLRVARCCGPACLLARAVRCWAGRRRAEPARRERRPPSAPDENDRSTGPCRGARSRPGPKTATADPAWGRGLAQEKKKQKWRPSHSRLNPTSGPGQRVDPPARLSGQGAARREQRPKFGGVCEIYRSSQGVVTCNTRIRGVSSQDSGYDIRGVAAPGIVCADGNSH